MGFFDDLLDFVSGTSTEETDSSVERDTLTAGARESQTSDITRSTGARSTIGESTAATSGTITDRTSLFSSADREFLDAVLGSAFSFAGEGTLGPAGTDLIPFLFEQAQGAPALAEEAGLAAENLARLEFERTAIPQLVQAAERIGSTENTTADLLAARASEDLATRLAGIRAGTSLQGLQLALQGGAVTADAAQRLAEAQAGSFSPVLEALGLARGADAVSTREATTLATQDTVEDVVTNTETERLIAELSRLLGSEELRQRGSGEVSSGSSILDWLALPLFGGE